MEFQYIYELLVFENQHKAQKCYIPVQITLISITFIKRLCIFYTILLTYRNSLCVVFSELGVFDEPIMNVTDFSEVNSPLHQEVAKEAALQVTIYILDSIFCII